VIRDVLRRAVGEAAERARADGALPDVPLPEVVIETPPKPELGDYATSLPLKLRRATGFDPLVIATTIAERVRLPDGVARVSVARPGFVNFTLTDAWLQDQAAEILRAGERFGSLTLGVGQRVQVEYVSANPTGPLHVGAGRNAALGDALANVLALAGYDIQREYYVNDAGTQAERLSASVFARYRQLLGEAAELPEDGYRGEYVSELAEEMLRRHGRTLVAPTPEHERQIGLEATQIVLEWVRQDLERLNVRFDQWFSEQTLYDRGLDRQVLAALRERGHVAERDGATWFTATDLGLDKDEVLIRSSGKPTYLLSDIAYHFEKLVVRGFDRVVDIWGADHHGQVPRLKGAMQALGVDSDRLSLLLYQLVSLMRGGEQVRMGKRAGTYVTLSEVIDEVGADAVRFFLVATSANAMMKFDLELARRQSSENPVHYVKYAHARAAGVLRNAGNVDLGAANPRLLTHASELALLRTMVRLPEIVEGAAQALAPHPLPYYAQEIAAALHVFYDTCRVISEDEELTRARLQLVAACKGVLANTLRLIGVSAPEQM
jgi:arginyl-tRNA synthetase